MVGVPGTLKGRINNARWTVSHNDGQEGETNVFVITDENVNYRWFIDLGPSNAETELIARLIAQAPYMLDVLMELVERFDKGTIRMDYLRRVLDDAKWSINKIKPNSMPIIPVSDLPATEEEAAKLKQELGITEG